MYLDIKIKIMYLDTGESALDGDGPHSDSNYKQLPTTVSFYLNLSRDSRSCGARGARREARGYKGGGSTSYESVAY